MGLGLSVFTGNKCNMNCKYCYINNKQNKVNTDIGFNKLIKALECNTHIDTITLIGGEPLIDSNIIRFLNFIKNENIKRQNKINVIIISNGTIYNPNLKIYKDIISNIQISIDGGEKTHNAFRRIGNKNAYQLSLNNLIKYHSDGFNVSINSVIYDIKSWKNDILDLVHKLPEDIPYGINIEEFNKTNAINDLYKVYSIIKMERVIRKMINKNFSFYFKHFNKGINICNAGIGFLGLNLENELLAPCHIMFSNNKLDGNIIGNIKSNKINVDSNILRKTLNYNKIDNYKIRFINKHLIKIIFKKVNLNICYVNNKLKTNDYFIIPFRYVLFSILIKIFRRKYV